MSEADTWPNGVPIITEGERWDALQSAGALRDLIATLWLYIGRYEETKLTTEQKELLADVVEATQLTDVDPAFVFDRWWQR